MTLAAPVPIAAHDAVRSAVLAAAHARAPRRQPAPRKRISPNNYVAEARRRSGAPAGNLNAFRHGRYCRETLVKRRAITRAVHAARANIALFKLAKRGVPGLLPLAQANAEAGWRAYCELARFFPDWLH
jgi:hypothetical protein